MNQTTDERTPKTKKSIAELVCHGPRVRCHFDNGQEFSGGKKSSPLFSWHVKGDFTLPLFPTALTLLAATVLLGTAARDKK